MTGMRQILIEARCPHCGEIVPLDAERSFADEGEQLAHAEERIDAHLEACAKAPAS